MNTDNIYYQKGSWTYLTPQGFQWMSQNDLIIDGSAGGLVLGPTAAEGGILLISITREAEIYVAAKLENLQYLLNAFASHHHQPQLQAAEQACPHRGKPIDAYEVPDSVLVIDARPRKVAGKLVTPVIFFETSMIQVMDKAVARENLFLFDEINRGSWQRYRPEHEGKETLNPAAAAARLIPRGDN